MIEHRPIASLTLGETRVLVGPQLGDLLFGAEPAALPGTDEMRLIDVLATPSRPPEFWIGLLSELQVPLLDVNRAPVEALLRIQRLSVAQAELLVQARPFFSLEDLRSQGADLQEIAELAGNCLGHEGYTFVDKPENRLVELQPSPVGLLVRYGKGSQPADMNPALQSAGLEKVAQDSAERLIVVRWALPDAERPSSLRALKERDLVETVAPALQAADGQVRWAYPDRIDLALHPGVNPSAWQAILERHGLDLVQAYAANYGSVRVPAEPVDLGEAYRMLRALAKEADVHFVEPTYLDVAHP